MDIFEKLAMYGDAKSLLMYSALLCPKFVIYNESVILESAIEDEESKRRFDESLASGNSRDVIEESFNMIEIGYLFNPDGRNTTDEEDYIIAERIASCWSGLLKMQYGNRSFTVKVYSSAEMGSTVAVSFFETSRVVAP